MEKIITGNDFRLIVDAQKMENRASRFDLNQLERCEIYLVKAGRARILQSYTLDDVGRAIIDVDGDALTTGTWGVEIVGTYLMASVRSTNAKAFQIVDGLNNGGMSGDGLEITVEVLILSNSEATRPYVDYAIAEHDADTAAHPTLQAAIDDKVADVKINGTSVVDGGKVANVTIPTKVSDLDNDSEYTTKTYVDAQVSAAGRVDDVEVNGTSVLDGKTAKITMPTKTSDLTNDSDFATNASVDAKVATAGHVDDVQVNGASVVSGKVANVAVPTKVSDITNDSGFQDATQVQQAVDDAIAENLITGANITIDSNTGTPSATVTKNGNNLDFAFANMKGEPLKFTDLTPEQKEELRGRQGDSVIVGEGDLPLAHVLGEDNTKAISQKGVTDEMVNFGASANIDISSLTPQACTLGNGKWYKGSSGAASNAKHVALPVAMGERYTLTNNAYDAFFAWMTSSYNPPYSNGDTMPLVALSNRILVHAGETVVIIPPEGAAFLVLAYIDGSGTQCDWTLVKQLSNNMGERFGQLADADFIPTSIDVKSHAWLGHIIKVSDTTVTEYSERWTARIVAAAPFLGKRVRIDYGASQTMCRYAFFSANIIRQTGSTVPYCKGETLRQGVFDGILPEDCKFIYFYDNSDGTNVAPSFTVFEPVGKVPVYDGEVKVNIGALTKQNCSLGAYNWYMASNNLQRHIAVPVNPGETYKVVTEVGVSLYAVVDSSYNPPYTSGEQIPFASCHDLRVQNYGVSYVTIPSDGAYLILTTTDGANFSPEISLYKVNKSWENPSSAPKDVPVKLRVMQWNVGHWAMGTSYTSNLTPETFAAKKMKYRQMLNDAKADIVCCCEWSQNVVNAGSGYDAMLARDELFGQYAHQDAGTLPSATSYMRTSHFSNMPPVAMKETVYNDTVQAGRYFHTLDFKINGKIVKIVATHLDWDQGEHGAEYRQSQMEQLISTFADEKYVIICADWNCDESEYDQFITAGYQMANHGYLGDLPTYDSESEGRGMALDNIVCKGFMVSDIAVYDDEYELSDHKPIVATFTMID